MPCRHRVPAIIVAVAVFFATAVLAPEVRASSVEPQGGATTAPISGVVVDSSGAVVRGAQVQVTNNDTAGTFKTATDSSGRFAIPALNPGTYTVTVSLEGFKTAVLPDVQLVSATPANIRAVLEVGAMAEKVVVTGATEIVQTQTAAVQSTVLYQQVDSMPVVTRNSLNLALGLPGIGTTGLVTSRNTTINGLPREATSIVLDGINAQDNRSHEAFFMMIRANMDSVQEMTASTATTTADSSGQGAAQIRITTRSGTNRFSGSIYNMWRNQAGVSSDDVSTRSKDPKWIWRLNTANWFTKRDGQLASCPTCAPGKTPTGWDLIDDVRLQTPGIRLGGPILKDKLFYFMNMEWFQYPNQLPKTRYLMNEKARQGLFSYTAADGSGTRSVDLLAIAASRGQTSTPDPTIAKLLADIRQATVGQGGVEGLNANEDKFVYSSPTEESRYFPTLRLDYNLSSRHRLSFSGRYNGFEVYPDPYNNMPMFPGFPQVAGQYSYRYMWQGSVRSTFGRNIVNEARAGGSDLAGRGAFFFREVSESMANCQGVGCMSAGGQGWGLLISAFAPGGPAITAVSVPTRSASKPWLLTFEDTLTWAKGQHSVSAGASWTRIAFSNWSDPTVPSVSFGVSTLDSVAYAMLDANSGNYPGGISATDASYARSLYAVLTGRVISVAGNANLSSAGNYVYLGETERSAYGTTVGLFVSDSWRVRPNLTLTGGLRYELQLPFSTNSIYQRPQTWQMVYGVTGAGSGSYGQGNLYKPGVLTGTNPLVVPYESGRPAYETDWNNLGPAVGAAWRPTIHNKFLSAILSADPVFRGGYTLSYSRMGTSFFETNYATNPGSTRIATRSQTAGTPLLGSDTVGAPQVYPVLLRDTSRLFPSAFPDSPSYPITPATNESIDIHYPVWPTPYTHQYSIGFQRELGKSMAIDIRYVGNTTVGGWTSWNMNASPQWSMLSGENGFYDEYRLAQQNLHANVVAGRGNSFAYMGPGTGTSPLPIFMAYLKGIPLADGRNQDAAQYASVSQFRNSAWYNSLALYGSGVPNAGLVGIAGTGTSGLQNGIGTGKGLDANRVAAGLPINFFMANPALSQGAAWLETTSGNMRYNSVQIELTRRMSRGVSVDGNYVFDFARKTYMQRSLREDWFYVDGTGGPRHNIKVGGLVELPFGRGHRVGGGASPWVDALIGNWAIAGGGGFQSGTRFDYGGYRLVGMTEQEFRDLFKFYKVQEAGKTQVYMFPQEVIQNSIIALYQTSATTATGYTGDVVPTGRYLAPASGPDCVQYLPGMCPGTKTVRIVTSPWMWNVSMSVTKQIPVTKRVRVEARMDLFNVFNTVIFVPTSAMGSTTSAWRVTAAATDSAEQYPGGRMTQFGLRVWW